MTTKTLPIRRDWLSKTLAGTLLGFALALGVSGLFAAFSGGLPPAARAQLAMWLVTPIWLTVLSLVFLFASGRRAWLWLGGANALVFGALALLRLS